MIGCTKVISVSILCSRCFILALFLLFYDSITLCIMNLFLIVLSYIQHRCTLVSLCFTNCIIPLSYLKSLPKLQLKLSLRLLLWQPLVTKTNDYTSGKSLSMDIKQEVYKRTRQEVSTKLESYIYKTCLVHATNN